MLLVHENVHMASMYDFKNNKLPEDCWGGVVYLWMLNFFAQGKENGWEY